LQHQTLGEDLVVVHYFTREREAGFQSLGTDIDASGDGTTEFLSSDRDDRGQIIKSAVIPVSAALAAAKEFAAFPRMRSSIRWFEL
jgi:hypothetical protein